MANVDPKLAAKAKELRAYVDNVNICVRELLEMGARPELELHELGMMQFPHDVQLLICRTMQKVPDE